MYTDFNKVLKKAAKRHQKSQVAIYEDYYSYAMSVALRFSNTRDEAKDIVHDAFIKAFGSLKDVRQAESFKPWFRRIVVNTAIDFFRKRSGQTTYMDIEEVDIETSAENILDQLSAEVILQAIGKLPEAYRMVFTLYAIEGYKHEEIATKLGIAVGTSKSNLAKARIKLKKQLAHYQKERGYGYG